jgi:UDP-glucose 4-epimerase
VQSVLVTGGEGFIGRNVRAALAAKGVNVVCLDSKKHSPVSNNCYQCDITDAEQFCQVFSSEQISTVVHLASCLRTASIENPRKATQVNVLGTLNVLEAARQFGVRRVVYGSSSSIYGSTPAHQNTSEEAPTVPEDLYGASKKYAELLGEGYARHDEMEFVAIRIPVVIGAGATGTSSPWRSDIFEKLPGRHPWRITIPFRQDETLTLLHVEDLADQIVQLVEAKSLSFACYNASGEIWHLGDLKNVIRTLNTNLDVGFGDAAVTGFAPRMSAERFHREFHKALKARLEEAAKIRTS